MKMEHSVVSVGGVPTEIIYVAARPDGVEGSGGDGSVKVFCVIPGNPGLVDFYVDFANELYGRFDGGYSVMVVSHVGHGEEKLTGDKIYTLEDQILHKKLILEGISKGRYSEFDHLLNNKAPQFILLGHSVGSYISLKVKARYPHLNISHIINLFPTVRDLWYGLSPVVKLLMLPGVRNVFSSCVGYSPKSVIEKLFYLGLAS
uniref:Lipid droplet-associated hydrolase n=1 Tax=Arcella intermedia TaxID=1963864 RepID=A0A6B2LI84_9EUKA